jgi:thioredoxin-related protein
MKKFLLFLIPVLVITGCKNKGIFTLEGTVREKKQDYIYLKRVDIDTPVTIDSAKIGKNGTFRFRVRTTETDFYQISYSPDDFVTLLAEPGEKIKLAFINNLSHDYTVSGSPGSEQIRELDLKLFKTKHSLDSLNNLYVKASKEPDFDKKGPLLEQEYVRLTEDQRKFNIAFVLKNMRSLAAVKALYQKINDQTYVLNTSRDLQYMKIVSDSLKVYYPDSKHTKALTSDFNNQMNRLYTRRIMEMANSAPEVSLDPDLKDVNGKRIKLSSLKGKYVLLSFWSADSRDCITENLQLKSLYNTYSKRGFEIYQINLDADESKWRNAVTFDELPWISTREDDPSNPVNAKYYNVRSLPTNYLYDREGSLIGTNLHGRNLQIKLEQLFK